ncbi:MAG: phage portal protein [Armatimonadetes bacterium]|jgi:hypothetical protein|nr:phage portal protein [Armatimonadota bacterium]MDI9602530.1 hypothetical protein [Acidobacteriota bacterium]NLN90028.1 phage portal protein [candidate division WS1 bacterium]
MRIFGYELSRGRVPTPLAAARKSTRPIAPPPLGRLAGSVLADAGRPAELELYRQLRRLLPLVDAAIRRLTRLVGYVRIEAPAPLQADLDRFLRHVPVNGLQRGFDSFLVNHVGQMLQYGFAAGRIVPDKAQRDIAGLVNLDSREVHVIDDDPPLKRGVGHRPPGAFEVARIPDALALFSANAAEGDSPYGCGILRSLPFVSHIVLTMERATQQTWERMGAPSYTVTWTPPEGFVDPDGARSRAIMGEIEAGFTEAMQTRHDTGLASDFFAAGDVRVEVIGAASEQLEFRETYRALTEQIVSVTGLPPFMLGLSWASTERMSSQQSEVIIAEIHDLRRELEPMVEQLVDLWLALTRRSGNYRVRWSEVTLQDLSLVAEAQYRQAMALRIETEALLTAVDRGWIDDAYARARLFPDTEPALPV